MKESKEHENNKKGNARNIRRYELGFDQLLSLSVSSSKMSLAILRFAVKAWLLA